MGISHAMKQIGAVASLSLGVAVVSLGLGASTAHATTIGIGPSTWCPGKALPQPDINWDMGACHTYYALIGASGNVGGRLNSIWEGDNPPVDIIDPPPRCGLFCV
jgi:hypothetical protein